MGCFVLQNPVYQDEWSKICTSCHRTLVSAVYISDDKPIQLPILFAFRIQFWEFAVRITQSRITWQMRFKLSFICKGLALYIIWFFFVKLQPLNLTSATNLMGIVPDCGQYNNWTALTLGVSHYQSVSVSTVTSMITS